MNAWDSRIDAYITSQGWTDATMLILLQRFVQACGLSDEFAEFLEETACEENGQALAEIKAEEDAEMAREIENEEILQEIKAEEDAEMAREIEDEERAEITREIMEEEAMIEEGVWDGVWNKPE